VGKETTGILATSFRLPFGLLAILTGWIVDRFGSRRMLCVYLFGCAATAIAMARVDSLEPLFFLMPLMGTFASIYHPAGLALISNQTPAPQRPRALAIHGVFGSAGIGGAPFVAGMLFDSHVSWQTYYALLAIPGFILAAWFLLRLSDGAHSHHPPRDGSLPPNPDQAQRWNRYLLMLVFGAISGFIYAAFATFLPRYLNEAGTHLFSSDAEAERNYLAGVVLMVGMVGQYLAGRFGRPGRLAETLALVALATMPFLLAMAFARSGTRIAMAMGFALFHFMTQPLYNALIAEYVPHHRRSFGYGLSFTVAFGIGSLGSAFAGFAERLAGAGRGDTLNYLVLAALATLSSAVVWATPRIALGHDPQSS
jgi:MFS family permease